MAASAAGYSAKQVLNFLVKSYPELSKYIQMATTAGFTANQIAKFIEKSGPEAMRKFEKGSYSPSLMPYPGEENNPYIQRDQAIKNYEVLPKELKTAGKMALGAAGSYALSRALPKAISSISSILGSQEQTEIPQDQQTEQPPIETSSIEPIIDAPQNPPPSVSASDLFSQMQLDKQIKQIGSTNTPDLVSKILEQHLMTPGQKKWLKEQTNVPLDQLVSQFFQETSPNEQPNASQAKLPASEAGELQTLKTPFDEIQKNSLHNNLEEEKSQNSKPQVFLPNGKLGTIESERNGIAKINVDGDIKHRKLTETIPSPLPEKDLADIYEEFVSAIPEKDRSAVINFAGYDPNVRELAFRPHNGALYVYKDIPEDFAEKLQGAMFKAKTTGENFYGAWEEGKDSRHAGLSALIKELQKAYGGKGKEYVRKYLTVYDFLGKPEEAKKEKAKQIAMKKREEKIKKKKKS